MIDDNSRSKHAVDALSRSRAPVARAANASREAIQAFVVPRLTERESLESTRSRLRRRRRRKFSLLQSLEKSENAEILRRHRGAPCLPNVDRNPCGRRPLTAASGASPRLRNSKAAQS